jgi:CheY-like chemotaxis protein
MWKVFRRYLATVRHGRRRSRSNYCQLNRLRHIHIAEGERYQNMQRANQMKMVDVKNRLGENRVLICDPDRVIANSLDAIFQGHGYNTRCVFDARDGLRLAREWQPDLVLTEIIMGEMLGVDFAKKIVALYPECRVILLSGQVSHTVIEKGRDLGFEFLDKPVRPDILLRRAAEMLIT